MADRITVRRLEVVPGEVVKCDYCTRVIKAASLMVRVLNTKNQLEHLMLFCDQGCAFAFAREDSDNVTQTRIIA